jgi:quinol-cytochrome oxidoreductase complex cytochrome b subunit
MIRRTTEERAPTGDGLRWARSVLLTALTIEGAVLLVTGVALFFLYRPSASQAWNDVFTGSSAAGVRLALALRAIHWLASRLAVLTAFATAVVLVLDSGDRTRRWLDTTAGVGIVVVALAASFTGFLLPWDQLALWAVTVGSDLKGYRPLLGPAVRFVLIDGTEVSRAAFVKWLLVHVLLLGPMLGALLVVAWHRGERLFNRCADSAAD